MEHLSYPLTTKSLTQAFADLKPEGITVDRPKQGFQEALVDGEWPLNRLRSHLKRLGFKTAGNPAQLVFINDRADVGVQLMGAAVHPVKNGWRTFTIEVQARRDVESRQRVHFS